MQPLEIPTALEPSRMHPHARAAHAADHACGDALRERFPDFASVRPAW